MEGKLKLNPVIEAIRQDIRALGTCRPYWSQLEFDELPCHFLSMSKKTFKLFTKSDSSNFIHNYTYMYILHIFKQ